MPTLDQTRAKLAFADITEVKKLDEAGRKKYASMVHAMPSLLRSAGLSQALHFVQSRKNDDQKRLVEHFAKQLSRLNAKIKTSDDLLREVRESELSMYLRMTQEALACANWYRRFVQGELRIEAGSSDDER